MAKIHLVVGPVGAGKSTFVRELCREHAAARLTLDEWMTVLFRPDRSDVGVVQWYVDRVERCVEQIWRVSRSILETGIDVVLEIGLVQRHQREAFFWRVDTQKVEMTVYVLDAPRDVRRERVLRRNQVRGETFSMEVPPQIFERASDMWQPLTPAECTDRDVRFLSTA